MVRQLRVFFCPFPGLDLQVLKNDDSLWFQVSWLLCVRLAPDMACRRISKLLSC